MPPKKNPDVPKKKRGRKPKNKPVEQEKPPPKKRGRKPKGGKIITKEELNLKTNKKIEHNIILHLKCNSKDPVEQNTMLNITEYDPNLNDPTSHSFNNSKLTSLMYENFKINTEEPTNIIIEDEDKEDIKEEIDQIEYYMKLIRKISEIPLTSNREEWYQGAKEALKASIGRPGRSLSRFLADADPDTPYSKASKTLQEAMQVVVVGADISDQEGVARIKHWSLIELNKLASKSTLRANVGWRQLNHIKEFAKQTTV